MAKIFESADSTHEVHARIADLQKRYHPEHVEAGLKVDVVFVDIDDRNADESTPALKLHGYPCDAVVRIVPLKQRAKGMGDAEIEIDLHRYDGMEEDERNALLDHELYHIEICRNRKTKKIALDTVARPKLSMRLHDRELGWFDAIAQRHGDASGEVQQARALFDRAGQFYWPELFRQVKHKVVPITLEHLAQDVGG